MDKNCGNPNCLNKNPQNASNFTKCKSRKSGLSVYCKDCDREKGRRYAKANKHKKQQYRKLYKERFPEDSINRKLKLRYGISLNDKINLLQKQNYKCAIASCLNTFKSHSEAHVDHSHTTGKIRELLCKTCNLSLGYLKDNIQIIDDMKIYLNKHRDSNE